VPGVPRAPVPARRRQHLQPQVSRRFNQRLSIIRIDGQPNFPLDGQPTFLEIDNRVSRAPVPARRRQHLQPQVRGQ
jgi:hypothetical protein